jgi:5'(3')-deoxyribonucleotidase
MIERKKLIQDQPGWWRNLEPLELGLEIVEALSVLGFRLMVLTKGPSKRNAGCWTEKVEWCRKHLPSVPVTITEDKGLVYGKILVDDWPAYVDRWLEWRPRGLVLMPAHPWNEGYSHPNVLRYTKENLPDAITRAWRLTEGATP